MHGSLPSGDSGRYGAGQADWLSRGGARHAEASISHRYFLRSPLSRVTNRHHNGIEDRDVLERDDLQFAQASSVADDVYSSDLAPREGEGQHPRQPAERRDNHSD
jgi:hypothetical protein